MTAPARSTADRARKLAEAAAAAHAVLAAAGLRLGAIEAGGVRIETTLDDPAPKAADWGRAK